MLKLRAIHMVLVLFYAEEIKRKVLDLIQATDNLRARFPAGEEVIARVPKGTKKATDKALKALVADGAITDAQKDEIIALIDYRNLVGHEIHNLVADLSPERYVRKIEMFTPERLKAFDYEAVDRMRKLRTHLGNLYRTHHYVTTINFNGLMFEAAERIFLAEAKRLKAKITRLHKLRSAHIKQLNAEFQAVHEQFSGELEPAYPDNRYHDGRLTARGVEVCYRLYDRGRSPMAVAHLMRLSLRAAVKRQSCGARSAGQNDKPSISRSCRVANTTRDTTTR